MSRTNGRRLARLEERFGAFAPASVHVVSIPADWGEGRELKLAGLAPAKGDLTVLVRRFDGAGAPHLVSSSPLAKHPR